MTQPPPIVPGNPVQQPQPYYPPQLAPPSYPQPYYPPDPNAGIRKAGTVAIWVWIVLTLVPLVIIGGCVALCLVGGIFGAATSTPTSR